MTILPIRGLDRIFFPLHEVYYMPISFRLIGFSFLSLITCQLIILLDLRYLI